MREWQVLIGAWIPIEGASVRVDDLLDRLTSFGGVMSHLESEMSVSRSAGESYRMR